MSRTKFLVVGATGHVGSKIAVLLAERGQDVTALVRREGATIRDPHKGAIRYVTGDLADERSIAAAVEGMDVVISTANGVTPRTAGDTAKGVNEHALRLIALGEEAGVRRFVQSSVPPYKDEHRVPELIGKRRIEERLRASPMQWVVIRNPAFMDVFLVMGGFKQAADRSYHATTKRDYGLSKLWQAMIGDLVESWGVFLAPGGAGHGSPMIATRDVAEMLVAGALYEGTENLLIEAGGPRWMSWREIADILAAKVGRKRVRVVPIPAWFARWNQAMVRPFSASAANTFALMAFMASHQPRWDSADAVKKLNLPPQLTVSDYLDENYVPGPSALRRRAAGPRRQGANQPE